MERRKGGERESRLHFSPVQAGDLYLPYDGEKEEEDASAAATATTSVMMPLQCADSVHKRSPRFRDSRRAVPALLHTDAESLCQSNQRVSKIKPRVTTHQNLRTSYEWRLGTTNKLRGGRWRRRKMPPKGKREGKFNHGSPAKRSCVDKLNPST